jgi:hypothetical protein
MLTLRGYLLCWSDVADLGDGSRERFARGEFVNSRARFVFAHDGRPGAILGHACVTRDPSAHRSACGSTSTITARGG